VPEWAELNYHCFIAMKQRTFLLFVVLFGQNALFADVTELRPEDRRILQDKSRFHEIHSTTNLPAQVVSFCADENGRMADPGKKWEVSDFITDATLPRRRLIWAATDGEYYVVHYESGICACFGRTIEARRGQARIGLAKCRKAVQRLQRPPHCH
jgi:hypothetical protein